MNSDRTDHYLDIDGEKYCAIYDFDEMAPFLMSIPSDSDLWMFVASSGGLTAGRVDAEGSLFPYETADRLYDGHAHTGPVTLVRIPGRVWEPFGTCERSKSVRRNLYKNITGNRVVFEETDVESGLVFSYRWSACREFGHVRTAMIKNGSTERVELSMIDGLRNILPFGAPLGLYQTASSLVDAYKRVDVYRESSLAVFSLTSRIIDRAEAAEQLRANTVWCTAPFDFDIHLSRESIDSFREGQDPPGEDVLRGQRRRVEQRETRQR
ncbi:MAG TPA: hypothetical protein VLA34_00300, partial [Candidatus Krumholzibacterium sp.]|nr:hypothetical protein [Candidatus Krumholzibacterium sp.]